MDGGGLNRECGSSSGGGGEIEQPTEGLPDLARARGCEVEGDAEGADRRTGRRRWRRVGRGWVGLKCAVVRRIVRALSVPRIYPERASWSS